MDANAEPKKIEQALSLASEAIRLGHSFVQAPSKTWRKAISSLFVARVAQAMQSVCTLASQGAVGDAMSVGRTIVELDIEFAYIMNKDTEKRWAEYVAYEITSNHKLVNAISILHDGRVSAKAIAHARRSAAKVRHQLGSRDRRARRRGQGHTVAYMTLRDRALATGRRDEYEIAYSDMCGASHGGFATLWYVTEPTDQLPIRVLVGYGEPAAKPISIALHSYLLLLNEALDSSDFEEHRQHFLRLAAEVREVYST